MDKIDKFIDILLSEKECWTTTMDGYEPILFMLVNEPDEIEVKFSDGIVRKYLWNGKFWTKEEIGIKF